ncbi:MAG: hypothetical protein WCK63_07540 [Betaproteobacteria bacterium]
MLEQKTLRIHGMSVHIRSLPSGDMVVWHPFNEEVRAVIEPVCRNRGRWNGEYNNWIVFRQFREIVCTELEAEASSH